MARKPNYAFERRERQRLKAEKRRKRQEAKAEKAEKAKVEKAEHQEVGSTALDRQDP